MKTTSAALQSLADAAGRYLYDASEGAGADETVAQELRDRLIAAEAEARDVLLSDEADRPMAAPVERRRRVQIVVDYLDNTTRYYVVPIGEGWKIDVAQRCLVIGRCLGRQMIPLDNMASFSPEEFSEEVTSR